MTVPTIPACRLQSYVKFPAAVNVRETDVCRVVAMFAGAPLAPENVTL
jgi:hypothetical protein